jgi:hypothetical protein
LKKDGPGGSLRERDRQGQAVVETRKVTPQQLQKLNERTSNVYENKGSLWKSPRQSRNVIDNKGHSSEIREYC